MNAYLELARPWQWYKNIVVFLALFFSGKLFVLSDFLTAFLAFLGTALLSSGTYVFNDILDIEKDRKHPKKRLRPLPSGRVTLIGALFYGFLLTFLGLLILIFINKVVFVLGVALLLNTMLYSIVFKKIAYIDVSLISLNFLFRTLVGVFSIGEYPSYWIIVIPYFLALFLALLKRYGELQRKTVARESLEKYDPEITKLLAAGSLFVLLSLYVLYINSHSHHRTFLTISTIPIAVFTLFRWFYDAIKNPDVAEEAAKLVYDKYFLVGGLVWLSLLTVAIYL